CRSGHVRTVADIPPVVARIQAEMEALLYPHMDVFSVRTAVHEALVNAVRHGHRGDPTRCVRLTYLVTPEYAVAEVLDEGPGFDPSQVPNPLQGGRPGPNPGRGLFLMRMLMTWTHFNQRGNLCLLCKKRSPGLRFRPQSG